MGGTFQSTRVAELNLEFGGATYYLSQELGRQYWGRILEYDSQQKFLKALAETCDSHRWECLAYCLLPSSFSLAIKTWKSNLNLGLEHFYRRAEMTGSEPDTDDVHISEPYVLLVSPDLLAEAICHLLNTPLRSRLVSQLDEWHASSYHHTIGTRAAPSWLNVATPWHGRSPAEVRAQIAESSNFNITMHLHHGLFLGDEEFVKSIINMLTPEEISESKLSLSDYARRFGDRASAMRAAFHSGQFRLNEIADHFRVHYSEVSRAIKE